MLYGIPKRYEGAAWSNWVPRQHLVEAVNVLQTWKGDPWAILLLSGSASNLGTGKTRALCSTVAAWREHHQRAFYMPVVRIVQLEHDLMDEASADERGTASWCCETPAMIAFDDLGSENNSSWTVGLVERIADERYANILPSIFATNLDERSVQARYPRLWRRCLDGLMLPWSGEIFRGAEPVKFQSPHEPAEKEAPDATAS
jgi:hypothetical protein